MFSHSRSFFPLLRVRYISTSPGNVSEVQPDSQFTFDYGDVAVVRDKSSSGRFRRKLVGPLEANGKARTASGGLFDHAALVGAKPRQEIKIRESASSQSATVHKPTLEEYILLSQRKTTPIYERDGSAIRALLDLAPGKDVLEAGTGTGATSLRIAGTIFDGRDGQGGKLISVDNKETVSIHAQKFVHEFERGKYAPYIEFHTRGLDDYLRQREAASQTSEPRMFDAALLDLPNAHHFLQRVAKQVTKDGCVLAYCPNITQVIACVRTMRHKATNVLAFERCLDITWRNWTIKSFGKNKTTTVEEDTVSSRNFAEDNTVGEDPDLLGESDNEVDRWVCRPENFEGNSFTAFLAVFKRLR